LIALRRGDVPIRDERSGVCVRVREIRGDRVN
jgi:hypothetical protein